MGKLLVNRDFARLWYGQAISSIGDLVFDTTLTLWIAVELMPHNRYAPAAVSGLLLCATVAIMVVGPAAGVFVDRWSHRTTMLRTEVIRAALVGGLTLATLLPVDALPVGVWLALIYAVVFVVNGTSQFFNPARFATIGGIVSGEAEQTRAFGISQATGAAALIIGPPLASPLLFSLGIEWALGLNALSYVVSYVAIRSMRFPTQSKQHEAKPAWWPQFSAGLRMFVHNRFLVALLLCACLAALGTGALQALMVFFVTDNLHAAPDLLGVMWMAFAVGSVVGALLAGRVAAKAGARATTWVGMIVGGAAVVLLARQTHLVPALVLLGLMALPTAALNAAISPQLLAVTPREFLGRMFAVFNPIQMAAMTTSVVAAGWLASTALHGLGTDVAGLHVGAIDAIFTVAGLLIVAAGVYGAFGLPPRAATTESEPLVTAAVTET
jgi:MFS family permease